MTLRDYFAAQALAPLVPLLHDGDLARRLNLDVNDVGPFIAKVAYGMADEMLKAREL